MKGLGGEFLQGCVSLCAALAAAGVTRFWPLDLLGDSASQATIITLALFVVIYAVLMGAAYVVGAVPVLRFFDRRRAQFTGDYVSRDGETLSIFALGFDPAARIYFVRGATVNLASPADPDGDWESIGDLHFDFPRRSIRYVYLGSGKHSRIGGNRDLAYGLTIMEFLASDRQKGALRFRDDRADAKYISGTFERITAELREAHLGSRWASLKTYAEKRRFAESYTAQISPPSGELGSA